jgi:hypothetical protein
MGNSIGANVSVQLNQDKEVCGGSTLGGTIYLDVEKDSISADSLNVRFYGHESTQITRATNNGDQINLAKHELVCLDYVLYSFNGEVNRGRYEYPFEITLPIGLPGKQGFKQPTSDLTMFQKRPDFFVIEYFVEGSLRRSGMLTWDVKNSQEILLLSDPPYYKVKTPSFIEPITRPVSFCGCYRTGTVTLLANVDSMNLFINDKIHIEYAIRNEWRE